MALVAVRAVVDVPVYTPVIVCGLRLGVAIRAHENLVVRKIGVTRGADSAGPAVVGGKQRVVERRSGPRGGRVADSRDKRRNRLGRLR